MSRFRGACGVIGSVALSMIAFLAIADTATDQIATQEAIINGDNNQVTQVINQITIEHPGQGHGLTNRSTNPDAYQGTTVGGSSNTVHQRSTQVNQPVHNNPGRRVGQTGHHPNF